MSCSLELQKQLDDDVYVYMPLIYSLLDRHVLRGKSTQNNVSEQEQTKRNT